MSTRLVTVGIDSPDPVASARWWAAALDWSIVSSGPDEAEIAPTGEERVPALVFLAVPEPKSDKNRLHLDLGSDDADDQRRTVERLVAAGAARVDVGQGGVPWVVLADPDGNELCVLEPRDRYRGAGRLAAVVVDARDPAALARFWATATGWTIGFELEGITSLHHPNGHPPDLDFVRVTDQKRVKNRLHLDVVAPHGAVRAEAQLLIGYGAQHVDIGQGDVPWVVLIDPEGNELCVLPPTGV